MVLPTSGSISISDINSCARFTNGNMGINTTSPNYNLDINGTLQATTITTSNIVVSTSISSGAVNATNSTVTNIVATSLSSGTLNLSTGLTSASAEITNSNVTTETIGTALVTTNLMAIGSSNTLGSIFTTGGSVGIGTTSPATDNGSRLSVVGSAFDGNSGIIRLYPATFGQKACIGFVSGQTGGSFWTLGRQNVSNEFALSLSTNTAGMYFYSNGNVSCGPLITTSLSTGTLNLSTGITSASAQITNSNVTTQTIGTARITGSLLALGNSNTVGNIFTTGGSVGIGTTAPAYTLDVMGSFEVGTSSGSAVITSRTSGNIEQHFELAGGTTGGLNTTRFYSRGLDKTFGLFNVENSRTQMRIVTSTTPGNDRLCLLEGGGSVGIGTTSPSAKLNVIGDTVISGGLTVKNSGGTGRFELNGTDSSYIDFGPDTIDFRSRIVHTESNRSLAFLLNGGTTTMSLTSTGNVVVNGALSKGSGTFDIQHPLHPDDSTKRLVHSFIEGPRCDLIYRGKVQLVNGTATINIDSDCVEETDSEMTQGTFEALCANPQFFLQNPSSFSRLKGSISGNILTVVCEEPNSNDIIYWSVIAERKDKFIKKWERTNANGYLITEYEDVNRNNTSNLG